MRQTFFIALVVALSVTRVEAENASGRCVSGLTSDCLQQLGAGSISIDDQKCLAQRSRYIQCLKGLAGTDRATSAAARGMLAEDPRAAIEESARRAYEAVENLNDPAAFELVAERFSDTFWGLFAARQARKLRSGGNVIASFSSRPSAVDVPKTKPNSSRNDVDTRRESIDPESAFAKNGAISAYDGVWFGYNGLDSLTLNIRDGNILGVADVREPTGASISSDIIEFEARVSENGKFTLLRSDEVGSHATQIWRMRGDFPRVDLAFRSHRGFGLAFELNRK